jgi:hypothetical protein
LWEASGVSVCQIMIDKVEADTLQQATRLTVLVSGKCDHGGEVYLRVVRDDGRLGAESASRQVGREYHHLPLTYTAHNLSDRLAKVRAVCRCKKTSVYEEREI